MKAAVALALALACLALVQNAVGRPQMEKGAKLHVKGIKPAARAWTTVSNKLASSQAPTHHVIVRTILEYGDQAVSCQVLSPTTLAWTFPRTTIEFDAVGSVQPLTGPIKSFSRQMCTDPEAAARQLVLAVKAGGKRAQAAAVALFNADCSDSGSASEAYAMAINAVNNADPDNLPHVASWFTALTVAADAVGIPVCASLAVVDVTTRTLLDSTHFHTGTAVRISSRVGLRRWKD